ncbi:hypothetical protein AVEN_163272-1 [Araneus ventricosus]|uniref:Uncharacterized protein n=1 Tax=Araneus ventricosus TaxID=182803 RepID=A0A4Y2H0X0_ARAVE|nr:hypothetical protein AVEN_163272-1 [Araneus ventricosus]
MKINTSFLLLGRRIYPGEMIAMKINTFFLLLGRRIFPEEMIAMKINTFFLLLGRRICPGEMIAMMEIFHYFTAVMQRFDIRPLENSPPNVDDGINGATYQPVPQKLKYIPRG